MNLTALVNFFLHKEHFNDRNIHKKYRLLVKACLLTSLFSGTYAIMSVYYSYDKGVYLMLFNVVGFLCLPFLAKTKIRFHILGNLYVLIGGVAVIALTYFSGGIWSAIYPWIISIPLLAILVVGKKSGLFWGALSFICMIWFGAMAMSDFSFPKEYDVSMHTSWYASVLPGLLLLILFIALVFENIQSKALKGLQKRNKQLEIQQETIGQQSAELGRLIEEKDYIIRILAHDLRNPLKNINSLLNLLKLESDGEKKEQYHNMIYQSSINAQNLVKRVLEMDASDQKDIAINFESFNLTRYLNELLTNANDIASRKQIKVELVDDGGAKNVYADKTYISLIFENLVSNAVKFSEPHTSVHMETSIEDNEVLVRVSDEGPGIHPEEQRLLFKKFSRLSNRPTAGESSTGLGLSLVKRYVSLINGKVWYERNEDKKGATFVVSIPLYMDN